MARLLVVEDDQTLNESVTKALRNEGHDVESHLSYKTIISDDYDLAILDINLPMMNGFELSQTISCPVIFLTARDSEKDMLKGFSLGCEDYITKPFSLSVFIEKIKVVLRHHKGEHSYVYKNLSYDNQKMQLLISDREVELTRREHEVLNFLIEHKGQVISKEQLLSSIWDVNGEYVSEGAVNVTINRIRKKMNTKEQWIQTVFGIGYRWSEMHEMD